MARHSALLLALLLSALFAADHTVGQSSQARLREARQCRMQSIAASRACRRVESEGGVTELWDDYEDQFQCAGLSAMRNTIQPECMSLPNYSPSPRLVYIQRGQGLMGMAYPGCPETFYSSEQPSMAMRTKEGEQMRPRDQHQKVHRIRQGDLVSIPAGTVHWCYNDGSEELVAFSVTDLLSQSNQLDPTAKSFFLAGGRRPIRSYEGKVQQQETSGRMVNVLQAFDANMMAEALGISVDLAKRMQREDERGTIVRVPKGGMRVIRPSTMEGSPRRRAGDNGMEEAFCNMKVRQNLDNPEEADLYARQTGRLYSVNMHKLPILQFIGMSAEKGSLRSNVLFGPLWSINAHTLIYITRGQGRTQIVSGQGKRLCDQNVRQGDVIIVPQFMASMHVAGDSGVEWVAFKTSPSPMRSPLVGSTSVFRGMPTEVIANAYRMSYNQAQQLKYSREGQMMMFSPKRTTSMDRASS